MKRIKRLLRKMFKKSIPCTHYYFNSLGSPVLGHIEKTGRGVVFIRNENNWLVKLSNHDVYKLDKCIK